MMISEEKPRKQVKKSFWSSLMWNSRSALKWTGLLALKIKRMFLFEAET